MKDVHRAVFTIDKIQQALTGPLPGITGQEKMAPAPVQGRHNRWQLPKHYREASVLLLLYPHTNSELHIALTRRTKYPGAHSGQISFPGGRREVGELLQRTALRETREEVGVTSETLTVMGQLSSLYTPPSNFCIYPFVAFSLTRPLFKLDSREVAELIEPPLDLLTDPTIRRQETRHFKDYGKRQIPFFEVFGHKVWGATAMILSEFLTLLTH